MEAQYQMKVVVHQDGRELRLTGCAAGSQSTGIKYDIILVHTGGPADCTVTAGLPFIPADERLEGRVISRYSEKNSSSQLKNSSLSSCDRLAQSMWFT
jgi:hypothetical protein